MTEQGREEVEQEREVIEQAEGPERPARQLPTRQPVETAEAQPQPLPEVAGATTYPYVFAIGRVTPRFPSLAVEKEFAQATGRLEETAGLTDRQATRSVLSERANRYLVRQICFVLTIESLETYILQPRDPADFDLLVDAVRPAPRPTDIDAVIGVRGPIAPPEVCNGLMVPVVAFDQIYSFDVDSLIGGIPARRVSRTSRRRVSGKRPRRSSTGSCSWPTTREPPTSTGRSTTWRCATRPSTPPPPSSTGATPP